VGVNAFERPDEAQSADLLKIGKDIELGQARSVQDVRASRDAAAVESALAELKRACTGSANVMPHLIDCVKAVATEGEIVNAMVEVFGRYTETTQF
jgi:methylmalonyl-CoA mutase N-terminal domain/subunit